MPHSKKSMTTKEVKKPNTDSVANENKLLTTIVQALIYSKRFTTLMVLLPRMSNSFVPISTPRTISTRLMIILLN